MPRFSRFIEVNQGKVGESFAAGAGGSNLPKCILTGGTATMSVSYQGKSYPICCTGCRDEFEADPEKYVKKAALKAAAAGNSGTKSGVSKVGKDDGSFDSLLIGGGSSTAKPKAMPRKEKKPSDPAKGSADSKDTAEEEKPEAEKAPSATNDKAARLLSQAQDFEKRGKGQAAVIFYRMVVKDHAGTPQAKAAAIRLKALGDK